MALAAVAGSVSGGCTGELGGSQRPDTPPTTLDPETTATFAPGPATIHRLTAVQLQNSWRALLGQDVAVPPEGALPTDDQAYGFRSIAAAMKTISPVEAEEYEAATYAVLEPIFADGARRDSLMGCAPTTTDDPCVRAYFERFGRLAWRRRLEVEEVDQLVAVTKKVSEYTASFGDALKFGTAAVLQSPNFLFRIEVGEPVGPEEPEREGLLRLTGVELASRITYLLLDAPPSSAILDAAESGLFDDATTVEAGVRMILDSPEGRPALVRFFRDFMNIARLDGLDKNAEQFPAFSQTLGVSMRSEIEKLFEHVVFEEGGDFRSLFTTRSTFVNEELARIYGIEGVTGPDLVPVSLPDDGRRAGLLTTPGFLAMNAHKTATSPTHRGRFVRIGLLCQDVPPPPIGVSTVLPEPEPGKTLTLRQRLEEHRLNDECKSCHQLMDPIGFGFEHFDALGQWREEDNGLPVDVKSDLDGKPFEGAVELADLVAELPEVGACIARRFYQHAVGRLDGKGDRPAVEGLIESFVSNNFDFKELVVSMVVNDGFRYVAVPKESP
ncbi:MAG: DUF1588 domain-containing protein [Deltaproteobacteria bacterium]|nr:DUF1588 domain-containing protein [Deltaproteobacteria bacterium]